MANLGNYQAAVDLFTEAINLDAKDFRFASVFVFPKQHTQFEDPSFGAIFMLEEVQLLCIARMAG